jgi:hypothetical protein
MDYLRDTSGANFHVDWKALEAQNISPDDPVTLRARNITLRKALDMTLSGVSGSDQLAFYNDQGVIEITTKDAADRVVVTKVYDIMDLLVTMPSIGSGNSGTTSGNTASSGAKSQNTANSSSSSGSRSTGGGSQYSSGGGNSRSGSTGNNARQSNGSSSNGGTGSGREQMAQGLVSLIMDTIEPSIWQENGGTATIRYFREGRLVITAPRRIHERIGGPIE